MRKFITSIFIAVAMMFAVSSCSSCSNDDVKFGVEYDLSVSGSTDGAVDVMFTNGHFDVDGAAKLDFGYSNVANAPKFESAKVYDLGQALASNDAKVEKAAADVDQWLNEEVKVTDFTGHYDLYIKGYVKETLTGLKFEVDRRITNLPETPEVVE